MPPGSEVDGTGAPADPRFGVVRTQLAPAEWEPRPEPLVSPVAEAAIALILRAREDLEILLVRRSESEDDPWSGHMALPGGRRSDDDDSTLHTAIRETEEETGVVLQAEHALGQLAPVSPQTQRVATLRVTPYVFGVSAEVEAHVASVEIDHVLWIPVTEFLDPQNHGTVDIPLISTVRDFPAYQVGGQTVWGMTYRVLSRFLDRYETD